MADCCELLGIRIPEVLLPKSGVDMTKWSVVACDQYTSQPGYWKSVEDYVGAEPSTLRLVFPEVYLESDGRSERIASIAKTMAGYLADGTLAAQKPGVIYIDRKTSRADSRKGILLAVDLEKYDYGKGSQSLIRATEGTIIERLPPRIKVREKAILELPHIMLLIDDADKTVIEPIAAKAGELEKLYDFDLMMGGGHIKGYRVDDAGLISGMLGALERLARPETFKAKYGADDKKGVLLFAVGDGNHSLATAKACWENLKRSLPASGIAGHPARYALAEVVNVHDEGLTFEPIHRVVFNVNVQHILSSISDTFPGSYFRYPESGDCLESLARAARANPKTHVISFIASGKPGVAVIKNTDFNLEAGTLQYFLDRYASANPGVRIDYIHGEEVVASLGAKEGNIGFYLPPMDKRDLFKTVVHEGVLPRKTFSMGEAEEKRFYLECRKIAAY